MMDGHDDIVLMAHFWNLTLQKSPLQLAPGVVLRIATEAEQARLEHDAVHDEVSHHLGIFQDQFGSEACDRFNAAEERQGVVLEQRLATRGPYVAAPGLEGSTALLRAQDVARNVLLGLRLLRRNAVWLRQFRVQSTDPAHFAASWLPYEWPPEARTPVDFFSPYDVTPHVGEELRALLPSLLAVGQQDRLRRPIRRFGDAYMRTDPIDAFIDHWIAIESMFTTEDQQGELTSMFRSAIAFYIGRNERDRTSIREQVSRSYKMRSDIVHGETSTRTGIWRRSDRKSSLSPGIGSDTLSSGGFKNPRNDPDTSDPEPSATHHRRDLSGFANRESSIRRGGYR